MNYIFVFAILLVVVFSIKRYYVDKYDLNSTQKELHQQNNYVIDDSDHILPSTYYLYPAFNHVRPVRQRGEYYYFPQPNR